MPSSSDGGTGPAVAAREQDLQGRITKLSLDLIEMRKERAKSVEQVRVGGCGPARARASDACPDSERAPDDREKQRSDANGAP